MKARPCISCGYDLTGQLIDVPHDALAHVIRCPECGREEPYSSLLKSWTGYTLPPIAMKHRRSAEITTLGLVILGPFALALGWTLNVGAWLFLASGPLILALGVIAPSRRDDGTVSVRRCQLMLGIIGIYSLLIASSIAATIGAIALIVACATMIGPDGAGTITAIMLIAVGLFVGLALLIGLVSRMIRIERRLCLACTAPGI